MNFEKIRIIAAPDTWIESAAIDQVQALGRLAGVERVVALPDLHPGTGIPVGCVTLTRSVIYPHIIGSDMGCGMSLFQLDLPMQKVRTGRLVKKLEAHTLATGSIGGGNHFAEFQRLERVANGELFERHLGGKGSLFLLVHSGSRGMGHQVYRYFLEKHRTEKGLAAGTPAFEEYREKHRETLAAARENRRNIAAEMASLAGCRLPKVPICEVYHNALDEIGEEGDHCFIHRKGATPAGEGLVVIPGSRGDLTWLVKPVNPSWESGWSLPHGAGRKWNRSQCRGRLAGKYTKDTIGTTSLGGRVVCRDRDLLYEEAPEAYKSIESVIAVMEEAGLLERVAALRPLVTYKA